jgi:hypothetical protein
MKFIAERMVGLMREEVRELQHKLGTFIDRKVKYILATKLQFNINSMEMLTDRLCGLVVRVPGYKSRGPGSIRRATRFSEK